MFHFLSPWMLHVIPPTPPFVDGISRAFTLDLPKRIVSLDQTRVKFNWRKKTSRRRSEGIVRRGMLVDHRMHLEQERRMHHFCPYHWMALRCAGQNRDPDAGSGGPDQGFTCHQREPGVGGSGRCTPEETNTKNDFRERWQQCASEILERSNTVW